MKPSQAGKRVCSNYRLRPEATLRDLTVLQNNIISGTGIKPRALADRPRPAKVVRRLSYEASPIKRSGVLEHARVMKVPLA